MTITIPEIKNWKTSLAGIGGYVLIFLQVMQQQNVIGFKKAICDPMVWLGFLVSTGLIAAKDKNVTGGTTPQTPEATARVTGPVQLTLDKN